MGGVVSNQGSCDKQSLVALAWALEAINHLGWLGPWRLSTIWDSHTSLKLTVHVRGDLRKISGGYLLILKFILILNFKLF
jgi:hypothetical protein